MTNFRIVLYCNVVLIRLPWSVIESAQHWDSCFLQTDTSEHRSRLAWYQVALIYLKNRVLRGKISHWSLENGTFYLQQQTRLAHFHKLALGLVGLVLLVEKLLLVAVEQLLLVVVDQLLSRRPCFLVSKVWEILHPHKSECFSIHSPHCCNRRSFWARSSQSKSTSVLITLLPSHNELPHSIVKSFIFFTHVCDCSVKIELISTNNCVKNSLNRFQIWLMFLLICSVDLWLYRRAATLRILGKCSTRIGSPLIPSQSL